MPDQFGPYRVQRKLATGGMAEVYLARYRGPEGVERTVVLKRILPNYTHDEEFVTMFLDEARLLAALSHPNIAHVFEVARYDDAFVLVMEYVHGPTLGEMLTSASKRGMRGLPPREALGIALSLADALGYAHGVHDDLGRPMHIIHRDLNPNNVIVSYDGAVKLIDFGIAKAASKVYETRTGVIKGTFGYMAPEQFTKAAPIDHRADVFALGVVLYEMLVGLHPFDASDEPGLLDRILRSAYKRARAVVPTFPEALDRVIATCLAPHPEGRPEDMAALRQQIVEFLEASRMVPTMGHIAQLVRALVPDTEGPMRVKPFTGVQPLRVVGASKEGTARVAGSSRPPPRPPPPDGTKQVARKGAPAPRHKGAPAPPKRIGMAAPPRIDEGATRTQELPPSGDDTTISESQALPGDDQAETIVGKMPLPVRPAPPRPAHDLFEEATIASVSGTTGTGARRVPGLVSGRTILVLSLLGLGGSLLFILTAVAVVSLIGPSTSTDVPDAGPRVVQTPTKIKSRPLPPTVRDAGPALRELLVVSEPAGAAVRIDGTLVQGHTTPFAVELPAEVGTVYVQVELDGYLPSAREVQVAAGQARFTLEPVPVTDAGVLETAPEHPTRPPHHRRHR